MSVAENESDHKMDDSDSGDSQNTGETENYVKGHDSFSFNKLMSKKKNYFSKKGVIFDVENIGDDEKRLGSYKSNSDGRSSPLCDYSMQFGFPGKVLLTSTLLDEEEAKAGQLADDEIIRKIQAIREKFSSFVKDVNMDLNDLEESILKRKMGNVQQGNNCLL